MDAGLPSASTPGTLHSLSAAVLDVEGESTHPLTLWQRALTAADDAVQSLASADAVLSSSSVSGVPDAAAALLEHSPPTAPSRQPAASPLCAVVPHGSTPLSAFDPAYWTLCFPHLFPFGEATEQAQRPVHFQDRLWARRCSFAWIARPRLSPGASTVRSWPSVLPCCTAGLSCGRSARNCPPRPSVIPCTTCNLSAPSTFARSLTLLVPRVGFHKHSGATMFLPQ